MRPPDPYFDPNAEYGDGTVPRFRDTKAELLPDGRLVILPPDEAPEKPHGNPFGPPGEPIDPNDIIWPEGDHG